MATVATLSLVAAACGDDDSDDDSAAAAAPDETTSASAGENDQADDSAPSDEGEIDTSDWPDTLVMGAVPAEESSALQEKYDPLVQVLEEDLGIEIELFEATEYAGIVEGQIAGDIHLAQYGPFSYVIATANGADVEPIGAKVNGPDEEPGYRSYAITQGDNEEIESLEDFAGKNVCFVDPASTSGYLYPSAGLLDAGVDPEDDLNPTFAGGHDASGIAVAGGDCEAGFAHADMVDVRLIEAGDIEEGDLKVVWESEVIASSPLAVSQELPESLRSEIARLVLEEANVDALVERGVCDSVETCGLVDDESWGWVEVDDTFYDGVRSVCEVTRAEACEG